MPMWNDLDRAVAGYGLTVIEYDGWRNRGHGTPSKAESTGCHHTAGPASGNTPSLNTVVYGRSDLPGPLCNVYMARNGDVYLIAAGIAYHAGATREPWQDNNSGIGIEAEATGVDPWPPGQYDCYARLCKALSSWYKMPVGHVLGHKEICDPPGRKIDPNFDMNAFRDVVSQGGAVAPTKPKDWPDDEENAMLILFHTDQLTAPEPGDPDAEPPVPAKPATFRFGFHGQRTAEAGGGSAVAADAWAVFSTAWGGCHVTIAEQNGSGGVHMLLGKPGEPAYVANNHTVPLHLGSGTRMVTVEGWRDTEGTVPCCDVYNLR